MKSAWILDGTNECHINNQIFFRYYTNTEKCKDPSILPYYIILYNTSNYLHEMFNTDYDSTFKHLLKLYHLFRLDEEVSVFFYIVVIIIYIVIFRLVIGFSNIICDL